MITKPIMLLLADDDSDDRNFFKDALVELKLSVNLTLVEGGEELMQLLMQEGRPHPHIIFFGY